MKGLGISDIQDVYVFHILRKWIGQLKQGAPKDTDLELPKSVLSEE